ncbi:MAG: response regulator [Deltaproteobacteria bacterium]|nr:response regulator [Deltaproteobacteria bacterium]
MGSETTKPTLDPIDGPTGAFSIEEPTEDVLPLERRAMLVTLVGPEAGRTYLLQGASVLIGRGEDAQVRINEGNVSRRHAQLIRDQNGIYRLTDLHSRNGTTLNGRSVDESPLQFGDRIGIGREVLLLFAPHDRLQEELIRHQRIESLGQLAAGVAHDFNNLLAIVLGNTSVLDDLPPETPLSDAEVQEIRSEVKDAALRAAQLAGQLLTFSRRGNAGESLVDLSEVVRESLRLAHRALGSGVQVKSQVPIGVLVRGDSTQLHQVVMNLLLNAKDAMPEGGTLSVTLGAERLPTGEPAPFWRLLVKDTGTGMDPATQARIFEPYFTTKAMGRGTGLGLATVLGIVQGHGGRIQVDSAPGQGSTFIVDLPRATGGRLSKARTEGSLTSLKSLPRRVLVVDDEEAYLRCVQRLLKAWGFEAHCAKSGPAALAALEQAPEPFEVVLLDYMMPEMRGDELASAIARRPQPPRLLVMSGDNDPRILARIREAGVDGFLTKPFTRHQLEGAIFDACQVPRA